MTASRADEVDAMRAASMSPAACVEYAARYLHAAQSVRRKHGRRAAYRDGWLRSAWYFRRAARSKQSSRRVPTSSRRLPHAII
jgi:hypothetical protein